jgi:hypothetical protein
MRSTSSLVSSPAAANTALESAEVPPSASTPEPASRRVAAISAPQLRLLADVTAPGPQRLWLETIAAMRQQPNAEAADLQRIQDWITEGVALDLESLPAAIDHKNTPSVLRNADLVRARLREYMAFGAVVQLAADHPCPFGVQPLHVIIKEGKKPRLVID